MHASDCIIGDRQADSKCISLAHDADPVSAARCTCCTGAADGSLKVWDKRKLGADGGSALFTFALHTGAVLRAEWSPSYPGRPSVDRHARVASTFSGMVEEQGLLELASPSWASALEKHVLTLSYILDPTTRK